ncbi:MAG: hypothetical protein GF332_02000 [Candidatus Moranbacteria bacterium]|nr:hypothetical protein [Candidatus Moranbacteria bacterium]
MQKPIIRKIIIQVIGDEKALRPKWAEFLDDMYSTTTICKIFCQNHLSGLSGATTYAPGQFDFSVLHAVKNIAKQLIGQEALYTEKLYGLMNKSVTQNKLTGISLLDIALWDLKAKAVSLPLYILLGGARDKIPVYASSPLLNDSQAYIEYIKQCAKLGFKAIKIHGYSIFKKDWQLIKTINKELNKTNISLILDTEGQYTREQALRMAKLLEQNQNWIWLEAPLDDEDLVGYKYLRTNTQIPIYCSGNQFLSLESINRGIQSQAWSGLRADATIVGGITKIQKIAALAQANHLKLEIQSWGTQLTQAANLHCMLSNNQCSYFELPFPSEPYQIACKQCFSIDEKGMIKTEEKPGLGVELDHNKIKQNLLKELIIQ